jgi:hypothetical protein
MKIKIKALTIASIITLSFVNMVFAGESITIPVSCSIPVVPGLNAPLIEQESTNTNTDNDATMPVEQKEESQTVPAMQQEEEGKEIILAEEKTAAVIVKTSYSR